jgi:hypothetical protein
VNNDPEEARKRFGLEERLCASLCVLRENIDHTPTDPALKQWAALDPDYSTLSHLLDHPDDSRKETAKLILEASYKKDRRISHATAPTKITSLKEIHNRLRISVYKTLGLGHAPESSLLGEDMAKLSWAAMRIVAGAGKTNKKDRSTQLVDGSRWDCPEWHAVFQSPDKWRGMRNFVIRKLAEKGHLPGFAAGFGIFAPASVSAP